MWYRAFTIASAQAFYWAAKVAPAFLKHCFIYPNEIEAVDAVTEFLRPMLSQGHAEKFVVNKDDNGSFQFESINVEGPITGPGPMHPSPPTRLAFSPSMSALMKAI